MDSWKELSITKKILIGSAILIAASFAPELMLLVDVGGIELAFSLLLVYFKPLISWLKCKYDAVVEALVIVRFTLLKSALAKPKVFIINTIYCSFVVFMTGSTLFYMGLFLPALLINGA